MFSRARVYQCEYGRPRQGAAGLDGRPDVQVGTSRRLGTVSIPDEGWFAGGEGVVGASEGVDAVVVGGVGEGGDFVEEVGGVGAGDEFDEPRFLLRRRLLRRRRPWHGFLWSRKGVTARTLKLRKTWAVSWAPLAAALSR